MYRCVKTILRFKNLRPLPLRSATRPLVPATGHQAPGPCYRPLDPWLLLPATRPLVPATGHQALGPCYRPPGSGPLQPVTIPIPLRPAHQALPVSPPLPRHFDHHTRPVALCYRLPDPMPLLLAIRTLASSYLLPGAWPMQLGTKHLQPTTRPLAPATGRQTPDTCSPATRPISRVQDTMQCPLHSADGYAPCPIFRPPGRYGRPPDSY